MSVHRILRPHSEVRPAPETLSLEERLASGLHNHITARDLMATFARHGWDWAGYYSFTMIRNPWDRIVSAYEYGRQNVKSINHRKVREAGSFAGFVESTPIRAIEHHAFDLEGRQLVSEIIRLEDIGEELPRILKALDVPWSEIPHRNATDRRPYRDYYGDETRAIVERLYARDIALGKYEF